MTTEERCKAPRGGLATSGIVAMLLVCGVLAPRLQAQAQAQAQAQDPQPEPERVPFQFGRLELAPTIRLFNAGLDGNVFKDTRDRASDTTATVQPAVDARFQFGRALVAARSELAYVYYKTFDELNSLETDNALSAEGRVNRVTLNVSGSLQRGRHREDYEIDAREQRQNVGVTVGADVAVTSRLSAGASAIRATERYDADAEFGGSNLAEQLNRKTTGERAAIRFAVTPLTTVSAVAERDRDRFALSPSRNADSLRIGSVVEINPLAMINGRVAVAYRERSFQAPGVATFAGTAARVDLGYTFRESTRLAATVDRDLAYSYRTSQDDYIRTTVGLSVARQLSDDLDAAVNVGRTRLTYLARASEDTSGSAFAETVLEYRGTIGLRSGRLTRVAFDVGYRSRDSRTPDRSYGRLTVTTSMAYAF